MLVEGEQDHSVRVGGVLGDVSRRWTGEIKRNLVKTLKWKINKQETMSMSVDSDEELDPPTLPVCREWSQPASSPGWAFSAFMPGGECSVVATPAHCQCVSVSHHHHHHRTGLTQWWSPSSLSPVQFCGYKLDFTTYN